MRRVGILGYGQLGQHLAQCLRDDPDHELAFVWNRSPEALRDLPEALILTDLERAASPDSGAIHLADPGVRGLPATAWAGSTLG